jgi:hypothetical protein
LRATGCATGCVGTTTTVAKEVDCLRVCAEYGVTACAALVAVGVVRADTGCTAAACAYVDALRGTEQ